MQSSRSANALGIESLFDLTANTYAHKGRPLVVLGPSGVLKMSWRYVTPRLRLVEVLRAQASLWSPLSSVL